MARASVHPPAMRRHAARGIALITAMLVAALVTAGAVALATSQQFDTRRIANIVVADRTALAVTTLEQQAIRSLRDDAKRGRHDALDEAWRRERFEHATGELRISGRLRDLQGRFNLTNLAEDPQFAGDVGGAGGNVPNADSPASAEAAAAPDGATTSPDGISPAESAAPAAPGAPPAPATGVPGENPAGVASATTATPPDSATAQGTTGAQQAEQQLRLLFKALELEPQPVQAILDWIDADTDTRFPNGAEDDYYTEQSPAYRAANRPLLSPRELLLVKGVTEEVYRRLAPFVTCLPQASRINVNTARKEVLMTLSPTLDGSTADILLRARKTQPFLTLEAFTRHPLLQSRQLAADSLAVASEYFELRSVAYDERQDIRLSSLIRRNGGEAATLRRWRENFDE